MQGIEISKSYFKEVAYPLFKRSLPEVINIWAVGLVGEGSECFKLDDDISQDHDFGPGFCIWLKEKDYISYKDKVNEILTNLPKKYHGYERIISQGADKRVGLFSIEDFYLKYTSFKQFPISDFDFLRIPETFLATVTNGEVFEDNDGLFSKYRNYLLQFYPLDVRKKKLAANLAIMAQAGQYNLARSLKRNDISAVFSAKYEFIDALFRTLFLLAKTYMPYYKLRFRMLKKLNYYPLDLLTDIEKFELSNNDTELLYLAEKISLYIKEILNYRHITQTKEDFLITQAEEVQNSIVNDKIRNLHLMKGK